MYLKKKKKNDSKNGDQMTSFALLHAYFRRDLRNVSKGAQICKDT